MSIEKIARDKIKRSRAGCVSCKRRKKKCDEIKPICSGCFKRNIKCEYHLPTATELQSDTHLINQPLFDVIDCNSDSLGLLVMKILSTRESDLPLITHDNNNAATLHIDPMFDLFDIFDEDTLTLDTDATTLLTPSPTSHFLQIKLPVSLNAEEVQYFEYYCKEILPNMSLLPQEFNHYSKICFPMAFRETSVLYCLILWGFKHLNEHRNTYHIQNEEADLYTDIIKSETDALLKNEKPLSKTQFFAGFVSSMLLVCMETSFGDTANWADHFTDSFRLLNRMPGNFQYLLNECSGDSGSVLAGNFAYFDVMASQSNENGTFYSMNEYTEVLQWTKNKELNPQDPLQGCIRPLVLQIGKIISLLVEYETLKLTIDMPECDKFALVSEMLGRADILERDIRMSKPDLSCLMDGKSTKISEELEFHLTLFEIYQIASQMYLKQVIRKLPPMVPEVEMLFYNLREDLKIMIEQSSLFRNSLAFPMLMLGICACCEEDRREVRIMFEKLIQSCGYLCSYYKIWVVVQKIWDQNHGGTVHVDWFKVTKGLGWKISLGR